MCELLNYRGNDAHIIYKNITSVSGNEPEQCERIPEYIAKLWEMFMPYADPDFAQKFPHQPAQHFWEMYLGAYLVSHNFQLTPTNGIGPDICIEHDGKKIWIEAIAPTNGQKDHPDTVPKAATGRVNTVPQDKILLRFSSALDAKRKKFEEYTQDKGSRPAICHGKDIKIIALSSAAISGWLKSDTIPKRDTIPFVVRAIFSIGPASITVDLETDSVVDQGYQFRPSITKDNGAPVETTFFTNPAHSDISAVIYSDAKLGNPHSRLGCDLLILHNPFAANPLPHGFLPCAREYWAKAEGEAWEIHSRDRTLAVPPCLEGRDEG